MIITEIMVLLAKWLSRTLTKNPRRLHLKFLSTKYPRRINLKSSLIHFTTIFNKKYFPNLHFFNYNSNFQTPLTLKLVLTLLFRHHTGFSSLILNMKLSSHIKLNRILRIKKITENERPGHLACKPRWNPKTIRR